MRNLFMLFVLLVFAGQLRAAELSQCKALLTDDFTREGSFHEISLDLLYKEYGISFGDHFELVDLAFVRDTLATYLEKEVGCAPGVVDFSFNFDRDSSENGKCELLNPHNPMSQVCYVESNVGYFVTNINFMDEFKVIYNRWD